MKVISHFLVSEDLVLKIKRGFFANTKKENIYLIDIFIKKGLLSSYCIGADVIANTNIYILAVRSGLLYYLSHIEFRKKKHLLLFPPFFSDLSLELRLAAAEPHFSWNGITLISVVDFLLSSLNSFCQRWNITSHPIARSLFQFKGSCCGCFCRGKTSWEKCSSKHPFAAHLFLLCLGFYPLALYFSHLLTVGGVRALIKPSVPVAECWDLLQTGWWWTLSPLALSAQALSVMLAFGWGL